MNKLRANIDGLREGHPARGRLEGFFEHEYAAIDPKTGQSLVILRLYGKLSGIWGCAVWVSSHEMRNLYGSGGDKTSSNNVSCGYHKPSTAAHGAIEDAGIRLSEPIAGVGETAIRAAVEAIARCVFGRRKFIVHEAHG